MWDIFICHATENRPFVLEIARLLRLNNIEIWLDKYQMSTGDRLTFKINEGLKNCKAGIVVLSPEFISKGSGLREHELDYLLKMEEEKKGKIFPVWLNVSFNDVCKYSSDLADIKAVIFNEKIDDVVNEIIGAFELYYGKKALMVPSWEDPFLRFLSGRGELVDRKGGAAGNIFETVIYLKDEDFPLVLGDKQYSRDDLWEKIAIMFAEYPLTGALPEYYKSGCLGETREKLWQGLEKKYKMKRPEGL